MDKEKKELFRKGDVVKTRVGSLYYVMLDERADGSVILNPYDPPVGHSVSWEADRLRLVCKKDMRDDLSRIEKQDA